MKKIIYVVLFVIVGILMIFMCYYGFNMSRLGTFFGDGGSADLPILYEIYYHSNYPDGSVDLVEKKYGTKEYLLDDNMFSISGYDFIGWNTFPDGSGIAYIVGESVDLDNYLDFYAQWEKIVINYGDINSDEIVNESDYLLLDSYVLGNVILDKKSLRNSDVNVDGKIDLVDVDIIKQFYLGIDGYAGILPNNPILKYEVYEDVNDSENDLNGNEKDEDDIVIDNESSGNGSNVSGGGTGNGGNSSSGNSSGNTGSVSNNNGNNGNNVDSNSSNDSNNNNDFSNQESNEKVDEDISSEKDEEDISYEFKYMIGNLVYSITECRDIVDGKCRLVLPKIVPNRDGYKFLGWSLDSKCLDGSIINNSISVDKGNIYYACFNKDMEEDNSLYIWIVIAIIWITVGIFIYRIVSKCRNEKEISE